jgi:hypothetical protein
LVCLAPGGFDPTPFHQLINELDSVENVLDVQDDKLRELLAIPPDPHKTKSLVNKLNSMAETLWNRNDRLVEVIEAYLGHPPDPLEPEVEEALGNVREAAMGIAETVYGE